MKRFVLAQRSADPTWKSSDNLFAGIVRMNSDTDIEVPQKDDEQETDQPKKKDTLSVPTGLT